MHSSVRYQMLLCQRPTTHYPSAVTTFESPKAAISTGHSRAGSIIGESLGTASGIPPLEIAPPESVAASTAGTQ